VGVSLSLRFRQLPFNILRTLVTYGSLYIGRKDRSLKLSGVISQKGFAEEIGEEHMVYGSYLLLIQRIHEHLTV
jgi:hypothetical protein